MLTGNKQVEVVSGNKHLLSTDTNKHKQSQISMFECKETQEKPEAYIRLHKQHYDFILNVLTVK